MKKILALCLVVTLSLAWNSAMGYRDEETGEFITRDPAGFVDGPNLYAYVNQNPWSKFDPEGLAEDLGGGIRVITLPDGHITILSGGNREQGSNAMVNPLERAVGEAEINNGDARSMQKVDREVKSAGRQALPLAIAAVNDPNAVDRSLALAPTTTDLIGNKQAGGEIRIPNNVEEPTTSPGGKSARTISAESTTQVKSIVIDQNKYPEAVQHLEDTGALDTPLTVDRTGASARRAAALRGVPTQPGNDRDEAPPAVFKQGSQSVRSIPSSDNRGAGAVIGQGLRGVKDNETVILQKKAQESSGQP